MANKKRKTRKKKFNKKNQTNITLGLFLVAFSLFAILRLGLLGNQFANFYRLFFGETYIFAAGLITIYGLVLVIYGRQPKFSAKRIWGFILTYSMVLTIFATKMFSEAMIFRKFMTAFWNIAKAEFERGNLTESLGGGIIGTGFQALFFPLLDQVGTYLLATILLIVGICLLFEVKGETVLHGFQNIGKFFITQSQTISEKSKAKYHDFVEQREEKKLAQEQEEPKTFTDPLAEQDDLPDVSDFVEVPVKKEEPVHAQEEVEVPIEQYNPNPAPQPTEQKVVEVPDFEVKHTNENYVLPPSSLLREVKTIDQSDDRSLIQKNTKVLQQTFKSFGVDVNVKKAVLGPTVTKYEIQPAVGVKVSRIVNLTDDLALALAAKDIRIEAPIPGKPLIGIEVPNKNTSAVAFRDVIENQPQPGKSHSLQVPLGKDVAGQIISADLTEMPHLLIAGSTGSGKSVAINTIITGILMKARPEEVKLVLIDPKMVELSVYNGVPHLLIPVVTDAKLAANALNKAVKEMERRYELFAASGVRNMTEFNQRVEQNNADADNPAMERLPYIVVIVDELSDLMMVAGHEVEAAIVRLAQMARAAGIHMILATQRPSVDVITGLIKANVPSRIAFAVSSGIDSRTILDSQGAERLIGRGDMLFLPIGANKPTRVQGAYISVDEVESVVNFVTEQQQADYDETMIPTHTEEKSDNPGESEDEFYEDAVDLIRRQQSASVSMLQRRFRIGYNRAARLVDEMEERGIVGPSEGSKPRKVLLPPPDDQN